MPTAGDVPDLASQAAWLTMLPGSRRDLALIGALCLLFATIGWALYSTMFRLAAAQDFMVFHAASRAVLDGDMALLFDGARFTARMNADFAALLEKPLGLHPWIYPPLFLVLVVPLGLLPFAASFGAFVTGTFLLLNAALRLYVTKTYQRWLCFVGLLISPTAAFAVAVGQNAFLTTALLVGGIGLLGRSPVAAGAMLGALTFKPQLCLMVPVALVAAREWRTLLFAALFATLLAAVSVALLGLEPWRVWLGAMLGQSPEYTKWLAVGRLYGQSAYAEAILLGLSARAAGFVQFAATLGCAALVWWTFARSRLPRDLRLCVLLTATVLAAPHVSNYDAVMVTVAVLLFLCRALEDGFNLGDAILVVVVADIELLDPPILLGFGLVTPLVYYLFIAVIVGRGRTALA